MISLKKSYARHLLQLALTLSLLRVDPENYIGYGWESQLALQNGDGWQLELRAAPLTDFPYSNRKALIPLIEDLVRFDRQTNHYSSYDVQTYLLNVQNEQISLSSVPIAPTSTIDSNTSLPMSNHQPAQISNELQQSGNATDFNVPITSDLADLFTINAEQFADGVSVFEQNLADLNDYGDGNNNHNDRNGARSNDTWNIGQLYAGLPLKDEPPELFEENRFDPLRPFSDIDAEIGAISSASTSNDNGFDRPNNHLYGMLRHTESPTLNLSQVIEWSAYFSNATKTEPNTDNETIIETTASLNQQNTTEDFKHVCVKLESEGDDDDRNSSDDCKNSTSGFSSNVELTEEESECVEVLYKQDVDLGYTLAPAKAPSTKESVNISGPSFSIEDNEKIKALQELKNDKSKLEETKPTLDDEWAGINFTVDNETGEYIQLPLQLEEILQDVLESSQVDELLAEYSELNGESSSVATASTSNQFDTNFSFPTEKVETTKTQEKDNKPSTSDIHGSELQLLLDSPFNEEELSADLSAFIDESNDFDFGDMIQSAGPFQHPHGRVAQNYSHGNANMYHRQPPYHSHHHHQSRLSLSRAAASMEIANMFGPLPGMSIGVPDMSSYSHYPSHYSYQGASSLPQHDQYGAHQHLSLHNISTGDMGANQPISIGPLPTQRPHYPTNLGSAVSTSMQITDPSHDSNVLGATSNYKTEHDMMNYYPNASSDLNQTTDVNIFNQMFSCDDELFMDIGANVNDAFYTNRMLEPNTTNNNSSVLSVQANAAAAAAAGSLNNNGAALLANAAGVAPQMQTTLNGNTATTDRLDASSDSAVSSMGSERVSSLSDGEWGDTGSDSAQEYHHSKYGAYDYSSYNGRLNDAVRHPVAQKKHMLYGKRHLQDQSGPNLNISQSASNAGVVQPQQADMPIKYEYDPYPMHHPIANLDGAAGGMPIMNKHQSQQCSIDFGRHNPRGIHDIVGHNHTYTLPQASGATPRSQLRDKKNSKKSEDEHLTRDEKRARTLNVPIAVIDIINLPMDEFNERLSKYDLSENQLSLIRDIRRRGKNKVAAQNCRKRKLDQIISLAGEVEEVRERKERLVKEQAAALAEQNRIKKKFSELYAHIFQNLRDPQGNPYSQNEYNLQQSADGRVHLLPRDTHNPNQVNLQMQHNAQQQQPNQQQQQQQQPTNSTHHISHHHNPRH